MPDTHRRRAHPIAVTTTISVAQHAKLQARAALQGLSRAQVLRALVEALPDPVEPATEASPSS